MLVNNGFCYTFCQLDSNLLILHAPTRCKNLKLSLPILRHLATDGASALTEVGVLGGVHGVNHLQLIDVDEVVHHLHIGEVERLAGEGSLPGHGVVIQLDTNVNSGSPVEVIIFAVRSVDEPSRL